ncbi:MAG TPA: hypothetical protein V6D06_20910 [Trichocoleus sp.]
MSEPCKTWYIIQTEAGPCQIVAVESLGAPDVPEGRLKWGPFSSEAEAVSRRIGLIRAGKCQPI